MPIRHTIDARAGRIRVIRSGAISLHDENDAYRARLADPLYRSGLDVLVDSREVDPPDDARTVRHVADHVARHATALRCRRVALVVGSEVMYGMARMYQILSEEWYPDTAVFRELEAAEAWLDGN
ncbi:MAG TPA: hypothetical protein P5135_13270 [Gemmatimonadales bacterium]|nr:hypothetical protein [Gemmatimonadales bacterium]